MISLYHDGCVPILDPKRRARPLPFRGILHEPPVHRIIVNIIYPLHYLFGTVVVAIISCSILPEPVSRSLQTGLEMRQQMRSLLAPVIDHSSRRRLLDRLQNTRDRVSFTYRINHQMHMVRHENISPHFEVVNHSSGVYRVGQEFVCQATS